MLTRWPEATGGEEGGAEHAEELGEGFKGQGKAGVGGKQGYPLFCSKLDRIGGGVDRELSWSSSGIQGMYWSWTRTGEASWLAPNRATN